MQTPAVNSAGAADLLGIVAAGDAPHTATVRGRPQDLRQNLIFRRLTERVHALGPRPCAEVMLAAADGRDLMPVLAVYAEIDERVLDWAEGRCWPPLPLRALP
jgi:hypothetical protein